MPHPVWRLDFPSSKNDKLISSFVIFYPSMRNTFCKNLSWLVTFATKENHFCEYKKKHLTFFKWFTFNCYIFAVYNHQITWGHNTNFTQIFVLEIFYFAVNFYMDWCRTRRFCSTFIVCTAQVWNSFFFVLRSTTYEQSAFKAKVNRHLLGSLVPS